MTSPAITATSSSSRSHRPHARTWKTTAPFAPSWTPSQAGSTANRSEEHTSELQSLMRISYAVFCLKTKKKSHTHKDTNSCIQHQHTYTYTHTENQTKTAADIQK